MLKGFLTGILIFMAAVCWSQNRGEAPSAPQEQDAPQENTGGGLFNRTVTKPDTFEANYFYLGNPYLIQDTQDTILSAAFFQPDPAYQGPYAYANLGNLGSAATPLVYEMNLNPGFDMGFHGFDIYQLDKNKMPFYRLKSSFTDAAFHQGRTQDDHLLNVSHAQEFGKALSFSIQHLRINHIGVFPNQKAFHAGLNAGMWYHHPNGRYQAFFTFNSNRTQHNENGGFDPVDSTPEELAQEETFPTYLANPLTHHQMREFSITQYFEITKTSKYRPRDTTSMLDFPLMGKDSLQRDSFSLDSLMRDSLTADTLIKKQTDNKPKPSQSAPTKKSKKPVVKEITKDSVIVQKDSLVIPIDTLIPLDSLLLGANDSLTNKLDSTGIDSLAQGQDSLIRNVKKKVVFYDPNYLFPKKRKFGIGHQISFYNGFYKFYDESPSTDSSYYGELQVYNQDLQYRIKRNGFSNSFFLFSSSIKQAGTKSQQTPRDFFKAGIKQDIFKLSQLSGTENQNNFSLFGELDYRPVNGIKLSGQGGVYFLGYNIGDYYIKGDLQLTLKKIGTLQANVQQQITTPSFVQNNLQLSGTSLWSNDFNKTISTQIGGGLTIAWSKTKISAQLNLIDNLIYYDTLYLPQQKTSVTSIPQLIIMQPLRTNWLEFDNTIVLQQSDDAVLPLPRIFTKHSLAVKFKLFRDRRPFWFGAQTIYHLDYKARGYQPLTGQFYLRNDELTYRPQVDVFLGLRVKDFRIYLRAQNAIGFFQPEIAYRTPDYPIPFKILRFGLSWRMLN